MTSKPHYVIKKGNEILDGNPTGWSKEKLKEHRNSLARELGYDIYDRMAGDPDAETYRELSRELRNLIRSGKLPHISRRS